MAANSHSLDLELSSSQYASITDAAQTGLDFSSAFTFAAWIKPESIPDIGELIFKTNYRVYLYSDNTITGVITGSDAKVDNYKYTLTSPIGNWTHVAITADSSQASATTFEFFVNGSSVGNGTAVLSQNATDIGTNSDPFQVGWGTTTHYYDGLIDELVVIDRVLTSTEIGYLYAGYDALQKISDLSGYWKFNNDYLDETANNNDLTSSGSPVFSATVPFANYKSDSGFFALL
jgi:hypothetical protein